MIELLPIFAEAALGASGSVPDASLEAFPTTLASPLDRGTENGQQELQEIFDRLPSAAMPDMPPEVAQLAEIKGMMEKTQTRMDANAGNSEAQTVLDSRMDDLGQMYVDVHQNMDSEALGTVKTWLDQNPASSSEPASLPGAAQPAAYTAAAGGPSQRAPGLG